MSYDIFKSDQFFLDVLALPYRVRKDENGGAYMIDSYGKVVIPAGTVPDEVMAAVAEMSAITRKHADKMATHHIRRDPVYNDERMPFYDQHGSPYRDEELKCRY